MVQRGTGKSRRPLPEVWIRPTLRIFALLTLLLTGVMRMQTVAAEGGTCIDDVTGRTNTCTANDVRLGTFYNVEDVECTPGTSVMLFLRAELLAGAKERYDIGLFVATDGGSARTGSCARGYLPPPLADKNSYNPGSPLPGDPGGPFYHAELDEDPSDACGDLEQGVLTYHDLLSDTMGITVPCVDTNGDGHLDIGTCVSWDNEKRNTCLDVDDAVPSTKSKCRCEAIEVGNVIVIPGAIRMTKQANPQDVGEPGGDVVYTFTVENTSEPVVTITSLVDSVYGDLTQVGGSTCTLPQTLAAAGEPGSSYSCSITAFVDGPPGVYPDTVTASGTDEHGNPVTASATEEVLVNDLPPVLVVTKSAEPTTLVEPGGTVLYTVQVANNSAASDPVTLTALADDVYGDLTDGGNPLISDSTCELVTIQPGTTYLCTFRAQVSGSAGTEVADVVTATGQDDEGNIAEDSGDAAVIIVRKPPDTGLQLPAPYITGGLACVGVALLVAAGWLRRRTGPAA